MKKIRVAFVGMAHIHLITLGRDFCKYPDRIEVVGVADYPPYTLKEREERYELNYPKECDIPIWDDYKELLAQNINVAIITTDIKDHAAVTEEILAMDIHVLLEKPMALSMEDAQRMYRAYKKSQAELIINWPVAWMSSFRKAKELTDSGMIGKVQRVQYRSPATRGPYKLNEHTSAELSKLWWYQSDRGGGSICDYAGYGCILTTWFAGRMAKRVSGFKKNFFLPFSDVEDYATFTIDFGESIAIVEGSWATISSGEIPTGPIIFGSEGVIVSDRYDMKVKVYKEMAAYSAVTEPTAVYEVEPLEDDIALNVANFIQNGTPLWKLITAEFNMEAMSAFDAGIRSCKSGMIERTRDPFHF